jgi:RNA methyltransferase, TrmH family
VVLDRGCADPWSPRALRAGAGGHFGLAIAETSDLAAEIEAFKGKVACTVPRGGMALAQAPLERGAAWIFGAEGSGLSEQIIRRADVRVTIPMAAGAESLNVAAAAAICLYQSFSRSAG